MGQIKKIKSLYYIKRAFIMLIWSNLEARAEILQIISLFFLENLKQPKISFWYYLTFSVQTSKYSQDMNHQNLNLGHVYDCDDGVEGNSR